MGNLFGIGANSFISRSLGQGDREKAKKASAFAFYASLATVLLYAALLFGFMTPILTAIGADGVLSSKERQFLRDVLGLSDDSITKYIKMYDSRMVDLVNTFADRSSSEIKGHTMMLIMSVCACDEKISREETAFIRKILE